MGDSVKAYVPVRTNRAPNPGWRVISGWNYLSGINPSLVDVTGPLPELTRALQIAPTNTINAGQFLLFGCSPLVNDVYTLSCYVYHEHGSSLNFAIRRNGANASPIAVPPNTWTRVYDTATLNPSLNPNYGLSVMSSLPAGTVVRFTGYLAELSDSLGDYFDGESPNCRWIGSPNVSYSEQLAWADRESMVFGTKNLLLNPSAEGSLAGIGGFWPSESIRTITTEEKYVGDSCLKVETTPVSNSVIGAIFQAAITPSPAYYPIGVQYYARAMFKGVAGRQYSVSIRLESTVNASLAFKFVTATGDWQEVTTSLVPTAAQAPGRLYRVNVEVLSRDNMSLGPQTFYVDAVSLSFSDVPYFDGDSDNAEWTGTANNSASVLKQFAPAQVRSYDGTNWVAG